MLTDDEMRQLELKGEATTEPQAEGAPQKSILSDEDMQKLELQGTATNALPPEISKLESGVRGIAQGASLGFADELTAGLLAGGKGLLGQIPLSQLAEEYRKQREESRAAYKAAEAANPKTYLAGEVGGGIAGAFVPGLAAAKGVKGAALLGGAMGLGQTEADLTKGEISPAITDIAKGAALGGTVGYAGEKLANALQNAPKVLERAANEARYGALGAKAKDIAKDLGLGKTTFPGKEVAGKTPSSRGMIETIKEKDILSTTGGSKGVLDKLDDAVTQNREAFDNFFETIKNTPKIVPNARMGGRVAGEPETNLLGQFNALAKGVTQDLKKQFGTQATAKSFQKDVSEYGKLLKDSDFDLEKLNELKQLVGKQLSETNWYTAGTDLAPRKDFLKKTYGLIKGRMEGLADSISPGAGQTMRKLNQEYGNLVTARGIAFNQYTQDLAKPAVTPWEVAGGAAAVGTGNPGLLAAIAGKKAIESYTGHSIPRLSKIVTAKTLDSMVKALQASSEEEAGPLAQQLLALSKNPSVTARMAGLSALLADPAKSKLIDQHMPEASKEVEVKTPSTTTGTEQPRKFDQQYAEPTIDSMQQRITPDMGNSGTELNRILENMKGRDQRSRSAMMFALQQNPAYRPLIKKLRGEDGLR